MHVKEQGVTRILFFSVCAAVLFFIAGIRIKENVSVPFHFDISGWKKCIFLIVLYKIGKKLSP